MHFDFLRHRNQSDSTGTFGECKIDGVHFSFFAEQPWNNNLQGHSCIPDGDYKMLPYNSPAHGDTIVFENPALHVWGTKVPDGQTGRALCEIHNANWPFQLRGCVAVGRALVTMPPHGMGVTESVATFEELKRRWGNRQGLTASFRFV